MITRVLILCGGEGERWALHTGVRKHLLQIGGERLLERTIRMAFEYCPDVHPIVRDAHDIPPDLAHIPGVEFELARNRREWGRGNNFLSSLDYWPSDPAGRAVLLFGDVYYTQAAMSLIMDPPDQREWGYLNRMGGNRITGKPYWEAFGWTVPVKDKLRFQHAVERAVQAEAAARYSHDQSITRASTLEMLEIDCGLCGDVQRDYEGLVYACNYANHLLIDDLTDDFDCPEDLDRWLKLFGPLGPEEELR